MQDCFDEIKRRTHTIASLKKYEIEIGVIQGNSKRKSLISVGLTNAELMYIHENGSALQNIPSRPVLKKACEYAKTELIPKTVDKIYKNVMTKGWSDNEIKTELEQMCLRLQNWIRKSMMHNTLGLEPNKRNGIPLVDTGQLARSITCMLIVK